VSRAKSDEAGVGRPWLTVGGARSFSKSKNCSWPVVPMIFAALLGSWMPASWITISFPP